MGLLAVARDALLKGLGLSQFIGPASSKMGLFWKKGFFGPLPSQDGGIRSTQI